jgi:Ca2+ transporting ATPase
MDHSFTRSPAELLRDFGVSEDAGLTQDQVLRLREKHGSNGKSSSFSFGACNFVWEEMREKRKKNSQLTLRFFYSS